ncbi:MAG: hypothetical protein ABSC48_10375 [Terracidiphilus sp.]
MKSKMKLRFLAARWMAVTALLAGAGQFFGQAAGAQAPAAFRGAITAINGRTLSVKTDAGDVRQVEVPSTAAVLRVAPGAKDLSAAETIAFSDLASGDRVLVKLDPGAAGPTAQALRVVAIKQEDLALKQQKEREDWQRRGVGGLVKSVDATAGVIVLTSGSGATAKTITVKTAKATILKRYAPASVRFDAALPAPIDAIHAGDQLRARGTKNADGTEIDAEEVVSGSFRNISGTIASLDAAGSTLVVKDLATKKPVTIHITVDAQMRRLPDRMAQALAARLKGTSSGGTGGWGGAVQPASAGAASAQGGAGSRGAGGQGQWNSAGNPGGGQWGGGGGQASGGGQGGQWGGQGRGGDPEQMLSRAPAIQLGDLQKGEAVMLVSTEGTTEVTAITLLAGVEPLLEAPEASRNLLANWSVGANTPDVAQ